MATRPTGRAISLSSLPPTWEALGLPQPDLRGRASSRAEGRGAGRSQLPWSCSSTGKAVWCSICAARASLHTSGDSGTPRHAQAVAMPVRAQHAEGNFFHLMAASRKGVLGPRRPAEKAHAPSAGWEGTFGREGPAGPPPRGHLWRDSHRSGRGGCACRVLRSQTRAPARRFTSSARVRGGRRRLASSEPLPCRPALTPRASVLRGSWAVLAGAHASLRPGSLSCCEATPTLMFPRCCPRRPGVRLSAPITVRGR